MMYLKHYCLEHSWIVLHVVTHVMIIAGNGRSLGFLVMYKGQKNWDYSLSDNSYPVVHAFIAGSDSFNNFPLLKQKLATIQQVEAITHVVVL